MNVMLSGPVFGVAKHLSPASRGNNALDVDQRRLRLHRREPLAGALHGVTSDLEKRIWQHRTKALGGFTARYDVDRLMHHEFYETIDAAIAREKQIKGWLRKRKLALIALMNPDFVDLAPTLFEWAKAQRRR